MLNASRDSDISCRYGGDEFCIILTKTTLDEAILVVTRMVKDFKKTENRGISFSIGLSSTGSDKYLDSDSFVKQADALMYKSKAKSKKKPGFYITTDNKAAFKI